MTDNFYKSEIDRELLLNIEIQKQNLKALPAKFKPQKKVNSPVTQQMIEDYKKQFRDSYKRTSADGRTTQFFKFIAPDMNLEEVDKKKLTDDGKLKKEFTDQEIEDINEQLDILNDTYYKKENLIRLDIEEIKKVKATIDKAVLFPKNKNELKNLIDEMKKLDKDIAQKTNENKNIISEINELNRKIYENDANILSNENYIYTAKQNNTKKISEYGETLKRLNEGQIDVTRAQGESEEDYLKRLIDVTLIEEDLTLIHLFNNNEFKKNLKPIVNSEWKIENISKAFTDDDKFLFNKTFAGFKKYFKDKYGIGNKNLDVYDFVSIIRNFLDEVDVTNFKKYKDNNIDDSSSIGDPIEYQNYLNDVKNRLSDDSSSIGGDPTEYQNYLNDVKNRLSDDRINEQEDSILEDELPPIDLEYRSPPPGPPPPRIQRSQLVSESQESSSVPVIAVPVTEVDAKPVIAKKKISELTLEDVDVKISNEDDVLNIENTANNKNVYFKLTEPSNTRGTGANPIVKYYTDKELIRKESGKELGNELGKDPGFSNKFITRLKNINLNYKGIAVIKYMISGEKKNITVKSFIEFFDKIKQSGSGLRKSKKSKRKKIVVQKGASIKAISKHVEFGKLILLLNKLVNQNILSIKDSNGINIPGLPNQKVSDKFVQLIQKIVSDEDITLKEVDDLNEKDSILYTVIMNKAGLKRKFNVNNVRALEALKNRLELVEGELEAGNDNKDIVKELYEIGYKLAYLGAIKVSEAKIHYKQTIDLLKNN